MAQTALISSLSPRRSTNVAPGGGGNQVGPGGDSRSAVVVGAGGTVAGDTIIGTITLPASPDNSPWIVYSVFGYVVQATATAGEGFGGYVKLNAASGDLQPSPNPSQFPIGRGGSFLGATQNIRVSPLAIWPCEYLAPGKSTIQMIYREETAVTVASQVVCGILFGKTIPENRRITYIERMRNAIAVAADTQIGQITLSENARRITHVGGIIAQNGVLTTAEELLGFFRLDSNSLNLQPAQYPFGVAFSAGLGALIGQGMAVLPEMIPVNIPAPGGAVITGFLDLNTAVTNAAEVEVWIAYE